MKAESPHVQTMRAVLWQGIRDSLYYTEGPGSGTDQGFWLHAIEHHTREHPTEVAAFRAELAKYGWDELMAYDWTKVNG